jgi:hypothetical protein
VTTALVILGFIALSVGVLWLGHRWGIYRGRAEREAAAAQEAAEMGRKAREIEDRVASLSAAERERLLRYRD